MAYKHFQAFLHTLDKAGEVKHIREPVSPHLEISRITDQESKSPKGGKALFFESVKGSVFPVVTNAFGSPRRICLALGVDHLDQLAARVRQYIEFHPPATIKEALNALPMAIGLTRFLPRLFKGKTPPCQQIVNTGTRIDMRALPVLTCWPQDAGPFITMPLVITRSLKTKKRNMGMYRMQVFDRNTTGMHWHIHKDGSHYFSEYSRAGQRMPVAVAIGADPATIYAATAPLPRGVDEIMLAGFIRNKPVVMTKCVTNDLHVPAEAEFVIEGYVDPGEVRREGPFGDHTGYYSLADDYPVFHVTAITHRRQPVYATTLVGRPPMEDCYLAKATERLFLPMLQAVMPEIVDYWFPWEGVFHNIVVVAIQKAYPGHAHKIISGLWGQGQMSFCKAIVVVDATVNPQNPQEVITALLTRFDPESDLIITKGILDVLDHASPHPNFGNKIGMDLTARVTGEPPRQQQDALEAEPSKETVSTALKKDIAGVAAWSRLCEGVAVDRHPARWLLALAVDKTKSDREVRISRRLLESESLSGIHGFILYDAAIDLEDHALLLWKLFNNVDPGRDILVQNGRMVLDASKKGPQDGHYRQWPDELSLD